MKPTAKLPVRWKGQTSGPFDAETLRRMLDGGDVSLNHQVYSNGQWVSMEEFAAAAGWLRSQSLPRRPVALVEGEPQETERSVKHEIATARASNHPTEVLQGRQPNLQPAKTHPITPLVSSESVQARPPQSSSPASTPQSVTLPAGPPPPARKLVHVALPDGTSHAYEDDQVRAMLAQGLIRDDALYWKEGMTDWDSVEKLAFPGLGHRPKQRPPKMPPSQPESRAADASPHPGIGRLLYFFGSIGLGVLVSVFEVASKSNAEAAVVANLAVLAGVFALAVFRLHNIGKSGWWSLLMLIPLANLYVGLLCLLAPAGYERTKKLDAPAKIISGVLIGLFLLVVVAAILAAAK